MAFEHNDIVTKSVLDAAIGNDDGTVRVNFTYVQHAESKMISDKTFDELYAAVNNGKILIGVVAETMSTGDAAVWAISWVSFYPGVFQVTFNGSTYRMAQSDVNTWTKD
jgi:hypothetical protein